MALLALGAQPTSAPFTSASLLVLTTSMPIAFSPEDLGTARQRQERGQICADGFARPQLVRATVNRGSKCVACPLYVPCVKAYTGGFITVLLGRLTEKFVRMSLRLQQFCANPPPRGGGVSAFGEKTKPREDPARRRPRNCARRMCKRH